ncbi:MAG: NAD(P)H-dependent glycerol-3-phosphate dehydrogenase [Ignavibacteria bacterium]|nr:NAD(P)H-dependent glycerol-3-phosphate dehydrogenase [Ignavibacteria bacterium]
MKTAVLGAGAWGTTLAIILAQNGHDVTLWEYQSDYAEQVSASRENTIYLPGVTIPPGVEITNNLEKACTHKDLIVLAIPTQFTRSIISQIPYSLVQHSIFTSVSKGIEVGTDMTISRLISDVYPGIPDTHVGVLSGPSHAEEVSRMIPTTVVAASKHHETAKFIQDAFMTPYFRVYSSEDLVGVELGGAFKNVIAVGAGIIDGLKFGDNTKAAIMTRGIAEISRLGLAMGAKPETFSGLSGMGDLIVTCMSRHSRNRYVGEKIGSGMKLKDVLAGMHAVAEGVATSKSASDLALHYNVETPITNEVYKILFEDKDPVKATDDLMTRERKAEWPK